MVLVPLFTLLAACRCGPVPAQPDPVDTAVVPDDTAANDTAPDDTAAGDTSPADADGDGYAADVDCDDGDPSVNPEASETWYDGVDGDCKGDDDFDQDGDGDRAAAHGGTDCDDIDPSRSGSSACRPVATCAHPSASMLAAVANVGIADIAFDAECNAYLPNIVAYDSVQVVDPAGAVAEVYATYAGNYDLSAIAINPDDGGVWVVATLSRPGSDARIGVVAAATVSPVATIACDGGNAWDSYYMDQCSQAIAHDGERAWVPNMAGNGTLGCATADGTLTTVTTLTERMESVALDPDEGVHVSAGPTIYAIDRATGAATAEWTFSAIVLDFVFDYDGSVFVETADHEVTRVNVDGTFTPFATVSYGGKLAIAPDGWLVRVSYDAGTFEEWPLGE